MSTNFRRRLRAVEAAKLASQKDQPPDLSSLTIPELRNLETWLSRAENGQPMNCPMLPKTLREKLARVEGFRLDCSPCNCAEDLPK